MDFLNSYLVLISDSFHISTAQIPLCSFTETSLRGKSWTNHLDMSRCLREVRDKSICVALMEFSPIWWTGKVGDKVRRLCHRHKSRKSATQIMKVGDTFLICVHDKVTDFVAKLAWAYW